jgi:glycosyltransferase involved in cell wall biosynthesis
MIVKNEEKYLADCLESVKSVVDHIVIVDTGSTDNTLEIAKSYNADVYHFDWVDDFSAARNFALSRSASDWILYLDADERLDKNSHNLLKKIVADDEKLGVRCKIYNIDEINKKPKIQNSTRLFKYSNKIKFTGKAHEQIESSLLENGYKIIDSDLWINHLGYNIDKNGLVKKAERNLKLLIAEYLQRVK